MVSSSLPGEQVSQGNYETYGPDSPSNSHLKKDWTGFYFIFSFLDWFI